MTDDTFSFSTHLLLGCVMMERLLGSIESYVSHFNTTTLLLSSVSCERTLLISSKTSVSPLSNLSLLRSIHYFIHLSKFYVKSNLTLGTRHKLI